MPKQSGYKYFNATPQYQHCQLEPLRCNKIHLIISRFTEDKGDVSVLSARPHSNHCPSECRTRSIGTIELRRAEIADFVCCPVGALLLLKLSSIIIFLIK